MLNRNLSYTDPGPLGPNLGRALFELLNTTNDGKMVMSNREGLISAMELLQQMGYIDKLVRYGRGSFRCDITQKGLYCGREHFGWTEAK